MRIVINLFSNFLAPASRRFLQALENPQATQESVQKDIINCLVNTEYGRNLQINSVQDWQHIPIVNYQDIENLVLKQKNSKLPILTAEPIIFCEKTSGSRSAAKLILYTKSLRRSFNQMFCVWVHDLIVNGANFKTGKIYFCISPQLTDQAQDVKTLDNDTEYLDMWLRWLLNPFLVSPSSINYLQTAEEFKYKLAQALLLEENLEVISIWSPTFLKVMLDYIQANRLNLYETLKTQLGGRSKLLLEPEINWIQLWRELKLISCWDSVNAADSADYLRKLFPHVLVQGKGLLATEAPMTIPLIAAKGCVPVLDEVFFEFADQAGTIHLLHELEVRNIYEIILSQKGGLYRYRIGDRVRVTHFYLNTPCLEFIGRTQEVSDLVGEKLNSEFVREVLASLPLAESYFKMLVPVQQPREHYLLLLDQVSLPLQKLAPMLDDALQASPQYRHARLLGQLQPLRIIVSKDIPNMMTLYKTRQGKKWGDLKHNILVTKPIDLELLAELEKLSNLSK